MATRTGDKPHVKPHVWAEDSNPLVGAEPTGKPASQPSVEALAYPEYCCRNCRFWVKRLGGITDQALCKRYAPRPGGEAIWPKTLAFEWCGEHQLDLSRLDTVDTVDTVDTGDTGDIDDSETDNPVDDDRQIPPDEKAWGK